MVDMMTLGDRARFGQRLAKAMVENTISVDAAASMWGLRRSTVVTILRASDKVRIPEHVQRWLKGHESVDTAT
mgnify:CR=1 FL=1